MDGPWQKYQDTTVSSTPPEQGMPWNKYKNAASTDEGEAPKDLSLARGVLDTGKTVGKSLIGLPAMLYQEARHPIDSLETLGAGSKDLFKNEKDAAVGEYNSIKSDLKAIPGNPSTYQQILHGGRAALTGLSAIPNAAVGVPYATGFGKLTEKATNGYVSPDEAAALPMMALGGRGSTPKLSEFGTAAKNVGMDFTKAKSADAIAKEITRSTDAYNTKLVDQIAPQSPKPGATGQLGQTAQSGLDVFQRRKDTENKFWSAAEQRGTSIPVDSSTTFKTLKQMREDIDKRINNGEDTPDVKKSKALLDRIQGDLGQPLGEDKPTRQTTAADLTRAHRSINDGAYAAADPAVKRQLKDLIRNDLSDAATQNKDFGTAWRKANQQTIKNSDVYANDAKAASFGFDQDTLRNVGNQLKQGRPIATADLQTINSGIDKIKTPEDVLFLQRTLSKPDFSMAMRAKAAAMLDDVGTNADKLDKARPMLEEVMSKGGVPAKQIKTQLNDLQTVSREMRKYDISSRPEASPDVSRMKQRMQAVTKAIMSFSPKYRIYHGIQALAPQGAPAGNLALDAIRKQAQPQNTTPLYKQVTGPAIGAVLNQQTPQNQQ